MALNVKMFCQGAECRFSDLELPLYTAARKGNLELAKLLLLYKADPYYDPRARGERGYEQLGSPLYAAVKSRNYKMVELLSQVPSPSAPRKLLFPALMISAAVEQGCTSVGAPKHMEPGTILHLLMKRGVVLSDAQKRCVEW